MRPAILQWKIVAALLVVVAVAVTLGSVLGPNGGPRIGRAYLVGPVVPVNIPGPVGAVGPTVLPITGKLTIYACVIHHGHGHVTHGFSDLKHGPCFSPAPRIVETGTIVSVP